MQSKIKSIQRALKVLEAFTVEQPLLGVTELSRKLAMNKSTIFNIVSTFADSGYLRQDPVSGAYGLGLKVLQLSYNMYSTFDVRTTLSPLLGEIAREVNETVYLGMVSEEGTEVVYIDALVPSKRMTIRNNIGVRAPLYCTGIGKALLAVMAEAEVAGALRGSLKRFTPNTMVTRSLIRTEIARTKKRGFSVDDMEHEYGIRCVGVALRLSRIAPPCGVSISGPSLRFDHQTIERYGSILLELKERVQVSNGRREEEATRETPL